MCKCVCVGGRVLLGKGGGLEEDEAGQEWKAIRSLPTVSRR